MFLWIEQKSGLVTGLRTKKNKINNMEQYKGRVCVGGGGRVESKNMSVEEI